MILELFDCLIHRRLLQVLDPTQFLLDKRAAEAHDFQKLLRTADLSLMPTKPATIISPLKEHLFELGAEKDDISALLFMSIRMIFTKCRIEDPGPTLNYYQHLQLHPPADTRWPGLQTESGPNSPLTI